MSGLGALVDRIRRLVVLLIGLRALWMVSPCPAQAPGSERVRLRLDSAEAVAVLRLLELERSGRVASDADRQRLYSTEGYVRLKAREAAMGRAFTDSEFTAFVRSDTLRSRRR
jgi:hypothetical protein